MKGISMWYIEYRGVSSKFFRKMNTIIVQRNYFIHFLSRRSRAVGVNSIALCYQISVWCCFYFTSRECIHWKQNNALTWHFILFRESGISGMRITVYFVCTEQNKRRILEFYRKRINSILNDADFSLRNFMTAKSKNVYN